MAQAQESLEELQKRKAVLDAQKATIDAEIALNESRKKLADAQLPPNPELAAARSAKEIADARKAQADSELAAFKAKIGEVPSSGIAGSVELTDKAGSMETALLAAVAVRSASSQVAKHVADSLTSSATSSKQSTPAATPAATPPARIVIFPAGEVPTFQATTAFFAQRAILREAFLDALSTSIEAERAMSSTASPPTESVAAVGVGLEAAAKILGFFRSDFKVGGSELTADHALLVEAVGGHLRSKFPRDKTQILLKAAFNPGAVMNAAATLTKELQAVATPREKAAPALKAREAAAAAIEVDLKKAGDADSPQKTLLAERLKVQRMAIAKLTAVIAAYDSFLEKLLAPDDKTVAMIKELDTWNVLQEPDTYFLVVKVSKAGGSHYVEKNLWTTFGAMPFKVMGGVIVTYALHEGASGNLVASGIVPIHGGFKNANKVGDAF